MKRVILGFVAAAFAVSCAGDPGSYHVVGSVANGDLDGSTIYLQEYGNYEKLDSAIVVDGKFEIKGSIDYPMLLTVSSVKKKGYLVTGEKAEVTIDADISVVQGEEVATINEMTSSIGEIQAAFRQFYKENTDKAVQRAEYKIVSEKIAAIQEECLAANSDNFAGAFIVVGRVNTAKTLEQLDSLVALAPMTANMYAVRTSRKTKEQQLKTAEGEMFIDFEATDIDGNPMKLSDYVGKGSYVLVDFWASWCGPCRAEMPNLKSVYDKHKANGLVLLGVNVWDRKEACIKAIEEESMTWPILYASDDRVATDSYGITGIPTIILFGPDGKIVNRTARGKKIMELIDGIYAE